MFNRYLSQSINHWAYQYGMVALKLETQILWLDLHQYLVIGINGLLLFLFTYRIMFVLI